MTERVTEADREAAAAWCAENARLIVESQPEGWPDLDGALVQAFAAHREQARREAIEECAAYFADDAKLCDCFAREDTECACGAWDDRKTYEAYQIANAFSTIRALGGQ